MELLTKDSNNSLILSDNNFGRDFNETLVHQVVVAYAANARQGTSAQKTRSEVSGGGRKPRKQKGSGCARSGTIRSPIWRSGGITFAAKPRDYSQKINRKMYQAAMKSVFSELIRQDRLVVVDSFDIDKPKTKDLVSKLKDLNLSDVFIVQKTISKNLELSSRNLHKVNTSSISSLNVLSLIKHENVLITTEAIKCIEEAW